MRTKSQILQHLEDTYKQTPRSDDKLIISQDILIEILVDIRDVLNERLLEIDRGIHALKDLKQKPRKPA